MATERDPSRKDAGATAGPELRLLDRRAFVGFPPVDVAPGLRISDFALLIPDVSFPFNFSGGAARYQKKKLHFGFLELVLDAEVVAREVASLAGRLSDLDDLKLHFRPGYIEGQARFTSGGRAPLTFKIAFDGDGERLALYVYDVRLYGFSTTPASVVGVSLASAVRELELLPDVELRGATGFSTRVLPALVQAAAVGRGYKMPALDQARLSAAEVTGQGLKLRFSAGGLPPPSIPDEELLLTLEGARAFADAEGLLAQGKLKEARTAYLKLGDVTEAHPFAIERLLTLLAADPQAHELALDVAETLASRRDRSATALWAEAVVRERRGESARAAERYLALCSLARRADEEASAFFAAESAARAARDQAPQMAVRALHEVLGLRPDHLPSLQALARAADQANDRAGAIRAWRRIAALARDPAEAAEAHVHMARLSALTEDDIAGARLHCEAALRLAPNHPEALYLLGELCHRAGEHLRAIKSLDRLREVALGRHEIDRIGRANVLAGRVWEEGLSQPENALLRYREAVSLLPGEPEPLFLAARVAEHLGKLPEAVSGYQQAIELAGPSPRDEQVRKVAHQSHHAMARLFRTRLAEPSRAREHLEAALALDPKDLAAIEELVPWFRAAGKTAELAEALEKAAAVVEDPIRRAALWAEAGELYRGRLARPERAEQLLAAALEADGQNRVALEGMLALAEAHRDGGQLCACLKALSQLEPDPEVKVRHLRRLAVAARDLAFDLDLAAQALKDVLALESDDLAALGELCALERRRADMNGLAQALEKRALVAETQGDKRLAASALRELSQVYEARLGRVAEALVALEKAARLSPDPALLFDLAELSLRCDRPLNARRALEDLLASLPQSAAPERIAEVRARLGRACETLGEKDAAREHYAQAFPLRRLDDELASRLEALYEESGERVQLAELWASRAQALVLAERSDEAAPLFLKSARALLKVGERSTAILRLNAALDAAPEGPLAGEILEAMADLELERGATKEAAKLLARRAAKVEEPRAAARLFFRAAQLSEGQPREDALLASALDREPRFPPARIRRAELLLETDPRAALEDLEAVLTTPADDPDAPSDDARLELSRKAAHAAARAGRTDTARRMLALYAARRPDDLDAQRELSELHRKAGAQEALCDQLSELWHRLSGTEQRQALREYAELCLELGRSDPAKEALRAIHELDPENLWAAAKLLPLLPEDGADDERLRLLTLLVSHVEDDERADLLEKRARLHRRAGRLDAARADLKAAIPLAPQAASLHRELAQLCRDAHDPRGELDAWSAATRAHPELGEWGASRVMTLSQTALEGGDALLAKDGFELALELPLEPQERCTAGFGLADAAQQLGEPGIAARALLEASRQGPAPMRVDALLRRAALLDSAGDLSGASASYEEVLRLAPHHRQATVGLKKSLAAQERWKDLSRILAEEAAQLSGSAAAHLLVELGELYLDRLGQDAPAENAFRRAAELDEGNVDVRRRLAGILAGRGEWSDAAAYVEDVAELVDAEAATPLLREFGLRAHQAGQADQALRLLRKAFQKDPEGDPEALEVLAELVYQKGAVREALPLVQRLADRADFDADPSRAEALCLRLAELAEQAGDSALCEATLRKVVEALPTSGAAAEQLSRKVAQKNPRESVEVLWRWAKAQPSSDEAVTRLRALAHRAREELLDVELCAEILRRVAELSDNPLDSHRALVELHRETGRTQELMDALLQVADLSLEAGDVDAAIEAFEEEARLAEQAGRLDEALKTLQALGELCEDEGDTARAAGYALRRAELLRDAKLDLDAAEEALQKAFELEKSLDVARQGEQLARRRDDAEGQADWLEKGIDLQPTPEEKALAFLELARLFDGPLAGPAQAEAAARAALELSPQLEEAEALLVRSLERDGRAAELAAHLEDRAAKETDPQKRAQLFIDAARIYRERAGRPDEAAAALIAARAARPEDLELTARCAALLHEAGRAADAAEFDAVLLEADPFREDVFARHREHLAAHGAAADLAALMLRRAESLRDRGEDGDAEAAARAFLEAAKAFKRAGAQQQALLCEDQAFESFPANDAAWEAARERATEVRRLAQVLAQRAEAVPGEKVELLRQRAAALQEAGEVLLAAEAFDDLLAAAGDDVEALGARAELAADSGGARASQPFDRRLLAAGGEALPVPVRVKTQLRLGHAALGAGAYQDAADAFEAVLALDGDGEKGREALSLLSEVHARTQNADGLFRTSLLLAQQAEGAEAEAFLRRAAELFDEPAKAVEALVPLARLRPADVRVVERAAEGLKALARWDDVVDLYEKGAEAAGGSRAAEWLLAAAQVCEAELGDAARADRLREKVVEHGDEAKAEEALWALAKDRGAEAHVWKLARLLEARGDLSERARLAEEVAKGGNPALAAALFEQLLGAPDGEVAGQAAHRLLELRGADGLDALLRGLTDDTRPEVVDLVLAKAREAARGGETSALEQAAQKLEGRRATLLRELFELHREAGRLAPAAEALKALLALEGDVRARVALRIELGELQLGQDGGLDEAKETFERALAEDPESLPAVRHLVALYEKTPNHERLVALVERLERMLGPQAFDGREERLAEAYEALGRTKEAYRLLSELPETPERLEKRAALAAALDLGGEALQLKERLTTDPAALEDIATGYARADLVPMAVRLAQRLLDEGTLGPKARREIAERLSPTRDGASFAVRLWPALLRERPDDADGWTLYSMALDHAGDEAGAERADGFGAALTGSTRAAPAAPVTALQGRPTGLERREPPVGLYEISVEAMPRLHASLFATLEALGAPEVRLWLHASGGVEAWMLSDDELVLGAAALGAFGPVELGYLCALALMLGGEGQRLRTVGEAVPLAEPAAAAFDAVPASLAACRVLAQLHEDCRGQDPASVEVGEVLQRSDAFRAIAHRALAAKDRE